MFKHTIITTVLVLTVLLTGVGYTNAQTTESSTMKSQIELLLKRIAELQAQLKAMQGEVNDLIKAGLSEGMTDSEIKEIQELLATDPEIYPSGLATGYFGPMTREAIKRFQAKFGLEVTGTLNEETRQALTEVRRERREKGMQSGLLKSAEVRDRIKLRLKDKWEDCDYVRPGKEAFCKDKKDKKDKSDDDMKDDDKEDHDDDKDDSDDSDDKDVSRDDARRAVVDAQNELNRFRADIDERNDRDKKDARDTLRKAQEEMSKARRALAKQEFHDAYEAAEEVIEILAGDDSDDDYDDDEDDDDSDDDDEDEDEEDDD